ncbi:Nif3-like dinuclear metal center hexameric protein [Bifidobacterium vespertilionis]|uniref:GTP cyclohydrolase 1 type 2 homolog n=1 Tax=Bifidobacterium vespertilionis TaxID=2562524 RepID=A0A5J5DY13_9BIFI|nr:Nif3-like dinuclear metal center hexameric protein [Bifidobacterium vespertilionis]KAA8821622.1 Nif3-like dinuclear metal center hexameric protein [Bifidobacterium vespertilionis]KAA8824702.1 Nif3-like dinuclear metal center hexameric protein [Bifidobacterium vespertilionis]
MPNLKRVVDTLERLYPLRYAESWDEPGLIVGALDAPVSRICCAVDPTSAVVDEAIERGADLLICHHPLFFRSVHQVSGLGFRGDIVNRLAEHRCALWVGHTNADSAYRGVAWAAADLFGLLDHHPLEPIADPAAEHEVGLGRVGELPEPMPLIDFARRVGRVLPHTELGVQVCGDLGAPVRRVALLPGSGDSMFDQVRAAGADVYVTSDLRHHPVTDAIEQAKYEARMRAAGIALGGESGEAVVRPAFINTPHSAIESLWFRYAVEDIPAAVLADTGETVSIERIERNTDPWTVSIHE